MGKSWRYRATTLGTVLAVTATSLVGRPRAGPGGRGRTGRLRNGDEIITAYPKKKPNLEQDD